jgi:hypothetical protein
LLHHLLFIAQGMFGGGIFAMGNNTVMMLEAASLANNSAAAGGAIATLGGSSVVCRRSCKFYGNSAKVTAAVWGLCTHVRQQQQQQQHALALQFVPAGSSWRMCCVWLLLCCR